jgi:hypothetical protein
VSQADPRPQQTAKRAEIIEQTVFVRGTNRPFGALTVQDVRARADELKAAVGFGPTARVAPVARAWRELSLEMDRGGAHGRRARRRAADRAGTEAVGGASGALVVLPGR